MNCKHFSSNTDSSPIEDRVDRKKLAGLTQQWWDAFEKDNNTTVVLRLVEELEKRKATITEYYWAYVYSQDDGIQYNLDFLDYLRLLYRHCFTKWLLAEDHSSPDRQLQEAGEIFKTVLIVRNPTERLKFIIASSILNNEYPVAS